MDHEQGDDYIRRVASFIRANEQGLAAAGLRPKRRNTGRSAVTDNSLNALLNPLAWFSAPEPTPSSTSVKPVVLAFDAHHLFYLFMRMEALGIHVGCLDLKVDSPSRPINYVNLFPAPDKSDTLSLKSFATSFSAVSRLSLGPGWWSRAPPPSVDAELKYIYSCFTKLPAISLHAPEPRLVAELARESPIENALPLHAFKSVQTLECSDVDPRTLLGWDRLAESLKSLTIKRSGLEDVSDIFISAVATDQERSGVLADRVVWGLAPPSRQGSFCGTQLPESVPESAEDSPPSPTHDTEDIGDNETNNFAAMTPISPTSPDSGSALSSLKWAFLRHLSLSDNSLTFLPTAPLPHLTSLTHLDLSSNLLVSVPPGLSALYNLVSLNLSDNMIDSVLGIYTMLGQVLHLNLARNRLESICGLERLLALERVDLRNNGIEESAEVGRLATLPNIVEIWIDGNPLIELEEGYRIRCFDLFCKEGKSILLDGAPPSFYEKRYLSSSPPEQMTSSRPLSAVYTPPAVPVNGSAPRQVPPMAASPETVTTTLPVGDSSDTSPPTSSPPSHTASPHIAGVTGRGRRKKNKRIVDLDGGSEGDSPRSASHSRIVSSDTANAGRATSPVKPSALRLQEVAPQSTPVQPTAAELSATSSATSSSPQSPTSPDTSDPSRRMPPRSRHGRHYTEYTPTSVRGMPGIDELPSVAPSREDSTSTVTTLAPRRSATLSSRGATRRARVSASVYEPPTQEKDGNGDGKPFGEAEAFRARIEALRSDMGDGWLRVFNQSHLGSPQARVPSG